MHTMFNTEVSESPPRIRLIGELDLAYAQDVTAKILASGCHVVDCSDLTFLDSSGVSALLKAHEHAEENGEQITFTGFAGAPLHVLEITGLNKVLRLA